MDTTIKVRDVIIGQGIPKICVSLIGRTLPELLKEASSLIELEVDIIEWRIDYFENVEDNFTVQNALKSIRKSVGNIPLLFTFRSAKEGGEKEITQENYFALNQCAIESGCIDLVDLELFQEEENIKSLVDLAKKNQVHVVISNHDFDKTPSKKEIVGRLKHAQKLGADIPKIAVMPQSEKDVITLLDATIEMKETAEVPFITMSMGGKGSLSRLSGEVFGSSVTFGAAKQASAPGQISVMELKNILNVLHSSLTPK